ncbi:MAG TPA: hypothetical protein VFY36_06635, partial [Solirubrobacteraceae bacterium]|nr:hypothetical protein [Solirubrobacteraceae bacterium]
RARSAAPARPLTTAPRPRRVSGPARKPSRTAPRRRSAEVEGGLALAALATLRSIDRHPLLDRLIGGRTLIVVVAFALIGIVTLQLSLLKLNAGIGRTLEQQASLQNENAALSIENSELAAGDRVEASAARLGMELVPVGSLRSLTPRPRLDAARAASALSTPVHEAAPTEAISTEAGVEPPSVTSASTSTSTSSSTSTSTEQTASTAGSQQTSEAPAAAVEEPSSREAPETTPAGGTQAGPAG